MRHINPPLSRLSFGAVRMTTSCAGRAGGCSIYEAWEFVVMCGETKSMRCRLGGTDPKVEPPPNLLYTVAAYRPFFSKNRKRK